MQRPERRQLALMLAPYVLGLAALVALPALATFALALFEYDLVRSPRWHGLANFRELWNDEIFGIALRNSLLFVAFAVPLRLARRAALALLLHRRLRGAGAYRTAAYLPTVVPDVAYALVWLWLLNPLYGPINLALGSLGAPTPSWLTDPRARTGGDRDHEPVPARRRLPRRPRRPAVAARRAVRARRESSVPVRSTRSARVTLPLMAPVLALLAFRDAVYSLQVSFVPALVITDGGPPPYATTYLPVFVYRNAFEYLRYGYAAAATLVMFVATALAVLIQYLIVRRWRRSFAA